MATDTWQQAHAAVVALWRRIRSPRPAERMDADLEILRKRLTAARQAGKANGDKALAAIWQGRVQELLLDEPGLAGQARRVLDETLIPLLAPADQARIGQIMVGSSHDSSTFNQVAGDQNIFYGPPPPATPVASTLPVDTAAFTGRGKQLEQIEAAAVAAAAAGRVVAIHAIDGLPGVGKTTLAVHVGHRVAGRFPDRQLFVDLHAHTPGQRPADPADVLAVLLAADGVDVRYLPPDLASRAAMWRSRMAGKRVLLILDNAASSDQVAPLLPGAAGGLVLVTSRRYLGDLPSALVPVPLDVLSPGEAAAMFISLAERAGPERAKVAEMVALCGFLPLAISLVASVFNRHGKWDMADLIGQTRARLLTVSAENRTVAAAFGLSYQYLPARQQRFFRHLGLHPGDDIDPYAAAALTGLPFGETAGLLDELHGDRLLDEPVAGRYRMHNLIHEYARALAAADNFADE